MGDNVGKIQTTISVGGGVLGTGNSSCEIQTNYGNVFAASKSSYEVGTASASAAIPIGKKMTLTPEVSGLVGKNAVGFGGSLELSKQLNPKLSINYGIGFDNKKFTGESAQNEITIGNEQTTGNAGEDELWQTGDFREQTEVTMNTSADQRKTTGYLTAGAKYQVNQKLSFNGGLQVGLTNVKGPSAQVIADTAGEYVTSGKVLKYDEAVEQYVYSGPVVKEQRTTHQEISADVSGNSMTGAIKAGAEYQINKNLSAGVQGQLGVGQHSDSFLGANLKVKF